MDNDDTKFQPAEAAAADPKQGFWSGLAHELWDEQRTAWTDVVQGKGTTFDYGLIAMDAGFGAAAAIAALPVEIGGASLAAIGGALSVAAAGDAVMFTRLKEDIAQPSGNIHRPQ